MTHLFEKLGILKSDGDTRFKTVPAVVMMLLLLAFVGTTFYILFSSLS